MGISKHSYNLGSTLTSEVNFHFVIKLPHVLDICNISDECYLLEDPNLAVDDYLGNHDY